MDDTQKRIAEIRERMELWKADWTERFHPLPNDVTWLLDQLDELIKFRWFAQYWATRVERILTEKGLLVEVLGEIGPCTPADAPPRYVEAKSYVSMAKKLRGQLAERDAEIARLKESQWSTCVECGDRMRATHYRQCHQCAQ